MDPSVVTAAIAVSAAVLGGGIAAIASYVNTRHKLRELELAASQKLRENYFQNAREYTNDIYVPLALAVSRLYDTYNAYQRNLPAVSRNMVFVAAVETFLAGVRRLRDCGAEAFLTNELEGRLRYFPEFLDASLTATDVRRNAVISYQVGFGGLAYREPNEVTITAKPATWLRSPKVSISMLGMGVTYEAEVVLAAPIDSLN